MKKKTNNKIEAEDIYSASYWNKVSRYNKSDKKIYDNIIIEIFDLIKDFSGRGDFCCGIGIYSVNYRRDEFMTDTPSGSERKKKILNDVKNFLIEKGFKCHKMVTILYISWGE